MGWFGKKLSPSDFRFGMIIQMEPGYYTTKPYYVEVVSVDARSITTTIPGHRTVRFEVGDVRTWEYQTDRMTIVGTKETHGHLLMNQELYPPHQVDRVW